MSYNKNRWIQKFGYKKEGAKLYLPVDNKEILEGSSITILLLDQKSPEKIEIHGSFVIQLSNEMIHQNDLTKEVIEFVESIIIGSPIDQAWMDAQGSLTLDIKSTPSIRVFVSNEGVEWPIEKWTYTHKEGYLSN